MHSDVGVKFGFLALQPNLLNNTNSHSNLLQPTHPILNNLQKQSPKIFLINMMYYLSKSILLLPFLYVPTFPSISLFPLSSPFFTLLFLILHSASARGNEKNM